MFIPQLYKVQTNRKPYLAHGLEPSPDQTFLSSQNRSSRLDLISWCLNIGQLLNLLCRKPSQTLNAFVYYTLIILTRL